MVGKKKVIISVLAMVAVGLALSRAPRHSCQPRVLAGFDSLNTRFIGNWPFGASSYAVACDKRGP